MSSSEGTTKPFGEWLSGGLFFGKGKDGIQSVDSCKDVVQLLNGIHENLTAKMAEPVKEGGLLVEDNNSVKDQRTEPRFLEARLNRVRVLLYDERRSTSQQPPDVPHRRSSSSAAVAGATIQALTGDSNLRNLLPKLIEFMPRLSFESRKHVASVFNYLLVCGFEGPDRDLYTNVMTAFRDYVVANFDPLLTHIVKGYDCSTHGATDVGLHAGSMYRSCFKHVALYQELVSTTERVQQYVLPLLDTYVHVPNFDISSCAMESLKIVLTAGSCNSVRVGDDLEGAHKRMADLAASFLTRDYEIIWDQRFNPNLMSDAANYMTKRMALQILSTVLLTRSNYAVMIKYVNSRQNLILVMHLLRDTSPHITLDAFHVFKVFVANPNKIPEVTKILKDNGPKLCAYLETLHHDKVASDAQFRDEKALIISTLRSL
jgi:calcium binding protein 39